MRVPHHPDDSGAQDNAQLGAAVLIGLLLTLAVLIAAIVVGVILLAKL